MHAWVAALTVSVASDEIARFQAKADSTMRTTRVRIDRTAEVLDVYCDRCGVRPNGKPWCPRLVSVDLSNKPRDNANTRDDAGMGAPAVAP